MEEAKNIRRMDRHLYEAAAKGNIVAFNNYTDLDLLQTPNENTLLHIHLATERKDMEESRRFVEKILNKCPRLLWQANANDEIPLHLAARYGLSNITQLLVERAKAPHEADPEKGDVRQMLRMTNKQKDTALHEAVRFDHVEVVKLLIQEDPHLADSANLAGETPLHLAVFRRFHKSGDEILEHCTLPALKGPDGRTVLHAAVIADDIEFVRLILRKEAGLALTKEADQQGWTPLHYVAHSNYFPMVKLLLEVDTSAAYFADTDGKTALHIAAHRGNEDVVEKLIFYCPDCCELVDKIGWNFLHFAVHGGNISIVKFASTNYLLLNEKDKEGNTPLHLLANRRLDLQSWYFVDFISHGIYPWLQSWVDADFIGHPRIDKMALNSENLSALDIIIANPTSDVKWKKRTRKALQKAGAKTTGQKALRKAGAKTNGQVTYEDNDEGGKDDVHDTSLSEFKKEKETHLVVAALIATVAFAASFTMPGGYSDTGTPALARKVAFDAFVISNTAAMMLSSSSVLIYIFLAMPLHDDCKFLSYFSLAAHLDICAIGAMMFAFIAGQFAVLGHFLGLATCVIAGSFFSFYYHLFLNSFGDASFSDLFVKALRTLVNLIWKAIDTFVHVLLKGPFPFRILLLVASGPLLILFAVAMFAFAGFVLILAPGLVIDKLRLLWNKWYIR